MRIVPNNLEKLVHRPCGYQVRRISDNLLYTIEGTERCRVDCGECATNGRIFIGRYKESVHTVRACYSLLGRDP